MLERNCFDCKYVEIFTHRVGSIGAPSRRTVFIIGTNTKCYDNNNINNNNNKYNKITILRENPNKIATQQQQQTTTTAVQQKNSS
jgi:hypothetical protein